MEATTTVNITPQMMAEAFWQLPSDEQATFFRELHALVTATMKEPKNYAWGLGERQWLFLSDDLAKDAPAREMLMTMAAPLYLHTLRYAGAA